MEFAASAKAPGRKFVPGGNNGIVETSNGVLARARANERTIAMFPHANLDVTRISQPSIHSAYIITLPSCSYQDYNMRILSLPVAGYRAR